MITVPAKIVLVQPASSKHFSSLPVQMPKSVGERGQPCLTPILQFIYGVHPSLFLNLEMTILYNLIATTLNSKGTLSSSSLFHRLFLGTISKAFLKSTKQQNRSHFYNDPKCHNVFSGWMILLKLAWPLSYLPFHF